MNIFILSNYVAWILTAVITASLLSDFIKNEFLRKKDALSDRRYPYEER